MRRFLAITLMVVAMMFQSAPVADATPAAPAAPMVPAGVVGPNQNTPVTNWFGCVGWGRYTTYGGMIADNYWSGNSCNGYTYVRVMGVRTNGSVDQKLCNFIDVIQNKYGCLVTTNPHGIRSIQPGDWTAIGIQLGLCADNVPVPYAGCYEPSYSPWGG